MKIYEVTRYDNAFSWFYYGTRKEAEADARRFRREYREEGEWPDATVEVEAIEFTPTRTGVADLIQRIIDATCVNEH